MLDVSGYLAEQLRAFGINIPACEEPMLAEPDGPYVTWAEDACREYCASGEVYKRVYCLTLTLWFPVDYGDWRKLLWDIADAVDGGLDNRTSVLPGVTARAFGMTGAEDVPAIRRKCARMQVHVHERVWQHGT